MDSAIYTRDVVDENWRQNQGFCEYGKQPPHRGMRRDRGECARMHLPRLVGRGLSKSDRGRPEEHDRSTRSPPQWATPWVYKTLD
jgi:hypothetical protein